MQIAVDIVFDDRNLLSGEDRDDLALGFIGRERAGGIVEVRHQDGGAQPRSPDGVSHIFGIDADARAIRDLDDLELKMFDHLQQAEIRRRFDQHRIARLTQHTQRQRDGVHGATGDHHMFRIGRCACECHALRDLTPQLRIAGRHDDLAGVIRPIAQNFAREIVQSLIRIHRRRGEGAIQRHDVSAAHGLATGIEHFGRNRNGTTRAGDLRARLWRGLSAGPAHIEAGLWSRLDESDVLQVHVGLHDGRDAHLRRAAHAAHGGNAVVGAQRAGGDLCFDQAGDAFVQERRLRGHRRSSLSQLYRSTISLPEAVLAASFL